MTGSESNDTPYFDEESEGYVRTNPPAACWAAFQTAKI